MITMTMDKAKMDLFMKKAVTNILRSQTEMARRIGTAGRTRVMLKALEFAFEGKMANSVALKVFEKNHRAEIVMSSQWANQVGLENEYNYTAVRQGKSRKLYKSAYPKIARWAERKGVFGSQPYVVVGGRGTHFGRQNKFFEPGFMQMLKDAPTIEAQVMDEAIARTRV